MAFYPFILLKDDKYGKDEVTINHEKIHLRQQLELLIIPFYIWYLLEFFIRYAKSGDFYASYKNISFEQEAYCNEHNFDYLSNRSWWCFTKYLKAFNNKAF